MRKEIEQAINTSTQMAVRLERLRIEDTELAEIVAYVIKERSNIEQLLFPHNAITDKGCKILANQLAPLVREHKLNYLSIEENSIGELGYRDLCQGLMTINPRFTIGSRGNKLDNPKADQIEEEAINAGKASANKTNRAKG